MINWRKIRVGLLVVQAVMYRIFVLFCNAIFFYIILGDLTKAISFSVVWNLINTGLYFLFHFTWSKLFQLGKETDGRKSNNEPNMRFVDARKL